MAKAIRWAAMLLLPLPAAAAVQQDELAPLLQAQTVMISTTFVSGTEQHEEHGAGVILCQDGNQAYVLTARHVVLGRSTGDVENPVLDELTRVVVNFFTNAAPPVEEGFNVRVITKQTAGRDRDLLLLTMPVQTALPLTATLGSVPRETAREAGKAGGAAARVVAVGYEQKDRSLPRSWAVSRGSFLGRDEHRLRHDASMTKGFSGGPLFDESGALIGINVEIGGEVDATSNAALPIDEVIETVNKWLPGICLQPVDTLREDAFETYREGMRAVGTKDWRQLETLMRAALADVPWEGGRVHLQGMRYTAYLPRYHLGLALYKQDRCAEALQEWGRSEVQRTIQSDKRYDKLKRLRNRCIRDVQRKLLKAAVAQEGS